MSDPRIWPDARKWDDGDAADFSDRSEQALAELLDQGVLFISGQTPRDVFQLCVNCNDVFGWACADAEPCGPDDLEAIYAAHRDTKFGVERWVALRRGERPQYVVMRQWQEAGEWDAACEALPPREFSMLNPKIEPKAFNPAPGGALRP